MKGVREIEDFCNFRPGTSLVDSVRGFGFRREGVEPGGFDSVLYQAVTFHSGARVERDQEGSLSFYDPRGEHLGRFRGSIDVGEDAVYLFADNQAGHAELTFDDSRPQIDFEPTYQGDLPGRRF